MDNYDKHVVPPRTAMRATNDDKTATKRGLSERQAVIGEIVASFVHEGRNALQQIQACCRLLEWEMERDVPRQELFADLKKAQDRLHHLFDELQRFTAPPNRCVQSRDAGELPSAKQDRSK